MDSSKQEHQVLNTVLDLYLVGSSLLVSLWLTLASFDAWLFLLLIFVLFGNCYWIFRLDSFQRLKDLLLILNSTQSSI